MYQEKEYVTIYLLLSLVFLLISNLTSWLRMHQLGTKATEANKSQKTDAKSRKTWLKTCYLCFVLKNVRLIYQNSCFQPQKLPKSSMSI